MHYYNIAIGFFLSILMRAGLVKAIDSLKITLIQITLTGSAHILLSFLSVGSHKKSVFTECFA